MGARLRKVEVRDLRDLEKLTAENVDSIEPGLRIIDSCLLLGHARVDLVGIDARQTLALMALGFTANEEMLLRILEAYSWCLEYPDTLRRLYPDARVDASRPPRVIFVAERLPDAFLRKLKQLSFPEIDCLSFLHLEVDGAPAVFFDVVEQRRPPVYEGPLPELEEVPRPIEQHPFIEGTPPAASRSPAGGNGHWSGKLAEFGIGAPAEPEASGRDWQGPAQERDAEAARTAASREVPPVTAREPEPPAAGRPEGGEATAFEQYRGEWQAFLNRLGSQLPRGGADAREPFSHPFGAE